jgi:serine/threonine protein kinase
VAWERYIVPGTRGWNVPLQSKFCHLTSPLILSASSDLSGDAKIISSLNHPHICVLHDIGHQDGIDYLVMECLEGETLAKRLEKGPLPLEQVLKYGAQIADALDKAHRSGVAHRDLKPGNIMLTATCAKLLDFGLAKPVCPLAGLATLPRAAPLSEHFNTCRRSKWKAKT